jgi:carboxymethylenebutenolidase
MSPVATAQADIKTRDGTCDAYVFHPEDGEPSPAVLFYMDAYGPRDYLFAMARKIAERGYFVLMPNLLYRARRAPLLDMSFPLRPEDMPKAREVVLPLAQGLAPEQAMSDADSYVAFIRGHARARRGKIAITGYCMGGGMAIRTAARFPDEVAAVTSFHAGRLVTDAPDSPHRLLPKIRAELYLAHADQDPSMPAEQIEALRLALESSGARYEAEVYAGAAHGFTMMDLPAGNAAALERHWEKLFEVLSRAFQVRHF